MTHQFHIPVMGIGFTIDTPIRIAHFGISSVMSLVDDFLLEQIRKYYCGKYQLAYEPILAKTANGRAERTTAYLNMVHEIVQQNMEKIKKLPFFQKNDKGKYFDLLPSGSPLKKAYLKLNAMPPGSERDRFAEELTEKMEPGSCDVNIMVKVDRKRHDENGVLLGDEYSDAKTALKGFAKSNLSSGLVFSAGINKGLFRCMKDFKDFYRNESGEIKKKIILKVSDFRSSLVQSRFLAQMGLEVSEYRIESGLNCGGHAFPSNGTLLPWILKEFKANRQKLIDGFHKTVVAYYEKRGWDYCLPSNAPKPLITVQGGIGTPGEAERMLKDFGMDRTGWGTPFLLVPEAVCVDPALHDLMVSSNEDDLFLSNISPLCVPFNLIRDTTSEQWTQSRFEAGKAGSPCPKKFLCANTEFTEKPICLASRAYQGKKLAQIKNRPNLVEKKKPLETAVIEKTCICDHLGNSALINLGIAPPKSLPTVVCPGPNLAWYDRAYTLAEMVNFIYGRSETLVPSTRPHMFATELVMYVDYFEKLVQELSKDPKGIKSLQEYVNNLEKSIDFCLEIAESSPYENENIASIKPCVEKQRLRLSGIWEAAKQQITCEETIDPTNPEVDTQTTKAFGAVS